MPNAITCLAGTCLGWRRCVDVLHLGQLIARERTALENFVENMFLFMSLLIICSGPGDIAADTGVPMDPLSVLYLQRIRRVKVSSKYLNYTVVLMFGSGVILAS